MDDIKKRVIEEFSGEAAVSQYTEEAGTGLWDSESILIKKYFAPGSSVLDIGCGTGRTTIPLFDAGYKVVGIDLTPKFIEIAKRIAGQQGKPFDSTQGKQIDYRVGDATRLEFNDSSFDNAIFSFNGWSQIPGKGERLKALRETFRILKPGGYFIFTAHLRSFSGKPVLWTGQWLKQFILKPLGFKVDELDFGDTFFTRDSGGERYQKQYIHIANPKEVKKQLIRAGFEVVLIKIRGEISERDNFLKSGNCMFYVGRKPQNS